MDRNSDEAIKRESADYIESLLDKGAYCVLVRSGPDFMAIRYDEAFTTRLDEVDDFLKDMDASARRDAIGHIMEQAASNPDRLAIIIGIFDDGSGNGWLRVSVP